MVQHENWMGTAVRPTGVPFMDGEHALLLELYGQLTASLLGDSDVDGFATRFHTLLECAADHFAHEEEAMRLCRYPAHAAHQQAHAKLLRTGNDLRHTVQVRFEAYDCYALLLFVRHWLSGHIRDHDGPLAEFLLGLEVAPEHPMTSAIDPAAAIALRA